jgi:hypothetical protein
MPALIARWEMNCRGCQEGRETCKSGPTKMMPTARYSILDAAARQDATHT